MKAQNTANRKENVLVRGILAYFCCCFILVPYIWTQRTKHSCLWSPNQGFIIKVSNLCDCSYFMFVNLSGFQEGSDILNWYQWKHERESFRECKEWIIVISTEAQPRRFFQHYSVQCGDLLILIINGTGN